MSRQIQIEMVVFLLTVVLAFGLIGCGPKTKDKAIVDTFRGMHIGGTVYDAAMTSIAKLHKAGLVEDEVKAQAILFGNDYFDAYQAAVDTLKVFVESDGQEGDPTVVLLNVSRTLGVLLGYINPILTRHGMEVVQ